MFTLVPSAFFRPASARQALEDVASIREDAEVRYVEMPDYGAVLIYDMDGDSSVSGQEMQGILSRLGSCPEYNKILCGIRGSRLYLAIAQGKTLLLANSYDAQNFTTAEYYIFLAVKSLQINPEMSTICWTTELGADDEMSLYRYFKAVVRI